MAKLNAKQQLFIKYYLADQNATQAAIKAKYSEKTAYSIGQRLLKHVEISKAISKGMEASLHKIGVTAEMVLDELRKIAFSNVANAYADDGGILHPKDMPVDTQAAVQSAETDELIFGKSKIGERKKVKLHDKVRSLELLGKHFKLFTESVEFSGKDGAPQVILHTFENGREAPMDDVPGNKKK